MRAQRSRGGGSAGEDARAQGRAGTSHDSAAADVAPLPFADSTGRACDPPDEGERHVGAGHEQDRGSGHECLRCGAVEIDRERREHAGRSEAAESRAEIVTMPHVIMVPARAAEAV